MRYLLFRIMLNVQQLMRMHWVCFSSRETKVYLRPVLAHLSWYLVLGRRRSNEYAHVSNRLHSLIRWEFTYKWYFEDADFSYDFLLVSYMNSRTELQKRSTLVNICRTFLRKQYFLKKSSLIKVLLNQRHSPLRKWGVKRYA